MAQGQVHGAEGEPAETLFRTPAISAFSFAMAFAGINFDLTGVGA